MFASTSPKKAIFALAQINPVMGDIEGNLARIRSAIEHGQTYNQGQIDFLIAPELVTSGYPPEDMVYRPSFIHTIESAVHRFTKSLTSFDPVVILPTPWRVDGYLYNAVLILDSGRIHAVRRKVHLPNYGVFDEQRVFTSGPMPDPVVVRDWCIGVPVCEDIWQPDICQHLRTHGAEVLIVPNGSPYHEGKAAERQAIARSRVQEVRCPLIYVNQVGGQDEIVFDGGSFVMDAAGAMAMQVPYWQDSVQCVEVCVAANTPAIINPVDSNFSKDILTDDLADTYDAMILGLRDYVTKNQFPGVILGLSGGIDSALSLAVAVDALGANQVQAVMMPSRYTSRDSVEDAEESARLLGIILDTVPIHAGVTALDQMLSPSFTDKAPDITEENIQARLRGLILMALSNKWGHMVLTTGNKSEIAVGYATLYGDMCGGYSVLKDVYKTQVFALSKWRNRLTPQQHKPYFLGPSGLVMPERVIYKPPSAELRPNQTDQDSLPAYDILDGILSGLVEDQLPVETLVARGYDDSMVRYIEHLLYRSEYKRRQAPPGVKITSRHFGRDRRYPVTNRFRDPELSRKQEAV